MNDNFIDDIKSQRESQKAAQAEQSRHNEVVNAVSQSGDKIVAAVTSHEPKVEVKNPDLAKTSDVESVVESINRLNITTFVSNRDSWEGITENLGNLADRINGLLVDLNNSSSTATTEVQKTFVEASKKLSEVADTFKSVKVETDKDLKAEIAKLNTTLAALELKPTVNVPAPEVTVNEKEVDFTPLVKVLTNLDKQIKGLSAKEVSLSLDPLKKDLNKIDTSIKQLIAKPTPVATFPSVIKISDKQGNDILDPTQGYAPSDIDESGDPKYYGFLAADGRWYIMRNSSDTTYRYITGTSDYATNWTGRAGLSYDYFSEVF